MIKAVIVEDEPVWIPDNPGIKGVFAFCLESSGCGVTVFADGSDIGACVNIVIDRAFILYIMLYLSSF